MANAWSRGSSTTVVVVAKVVLRRSIDKCITTVVVVTKLNVKDATRVKAQITYKMERKEEDDDGDMMME